ncbi:MAG: metabolite traffic protein EboE [Verrucomicrobiota bacterium]|jgi:sugar phosphate isomerase/epimerase|nr:metabolite traffic protein EboE [Verrucomicrobiota bacterium]
MNPIPYCLNIHPGESLAEVREAILRHAVAVKARVSPDAPYPLGLRLSAAATEALMSGTALAAFQTLLTEHGFTVSCVNGFPFGAFHGTAVKTAVYQPDWTAQERFSYTASLAAVLAMLLPEGQTGSISTVPLGYRHAPPAPAALFSHPQAIAITAKLLDTLRRAKGQEIVLALEPEPDCLLENTDDVVTWFENTLLPEGVRWLTRVQPRQYTPAEAEAVLRRHIGVCVDTCHFAVAFEDPLAAIKRFERAGIRVARVQLSAAIRAAVSGDSLERLAAFIDPVYLHQTKLRLPDGKIRAWPDLTPETLAAARAHSGREIRTHFHVPLFFDGDGALGSTNIDLTPAFFAHVRERGYPLEIETYTFNVLPPALRCADVVDSLVREHDWVSARLA